MNIEDSHNTLWLVARLLPFLACLPFSTTVGYAGTSHAACNSLTTLPSSVYRFAADLDGVGGPDLFVADRTGESTVITACDHGSLGAWDMRDTNKPLNMVVVVDVEGDGTDELIVGGPTGSSPLTGTVSRLIGTRLEPSEKVSIRPASDLLVGKTFRCVATDDDGLRKIVNYTYRISEDGSEMHWYGSDESEGML